MTLPQKQNRCNQKREEVCRVRVPQLPKALTVIGGESETSTLKEEKKEENWHSSFLTRFYNWRPEVTKRSRSFAGQHQERPLSL